jgi:hypothetical protein
LRSANLHDMSWICTPDPGAACTANGSGDILDNVSLPPGAAIVYELTGSVVAIPEIAAELDATVGVFGGIPDLNPLNDSASDIDATGIFADGFDTPPDVASGADRMTAATAKEARKR